LPATALATAFNLAVAFLMVAFRVPSCSEGLLGPALLAAPLGVRLTAVMEKKWLNLADAEARSSAASPSPLALMTAARLDAGARRSALTSSSRSHHD